jgi:hypothetical protein
MEFDDLFNDDDMTFLEPIKLSKDEFIIKTKKLIEDIMQEYGQCFESYNPEIQDPPNCNRCHGWTQIEQGGETVDCYVCNGEGIIKYAELNKERFVQFLEESILFNDFNELLSCEISE